MTPDFNAADTDTWPVVLTPDHVSAIYARSVGAIKKACQTHRFLPAPYKTHPYRWRKIDVLRDVEGARGAGLRRVS